MTSWFSVVLLAVVGFCSYGQEAQTNSEVKLPNTISTLLPPPAAPFETNKIASSATASTNVLIQNEDWIIPENTSQKWVLSPPTLYGSKETSKSQMCLFTDTKPQVTKGTNGTWKISFGNTNTLELLFRGVADTSYHAGATEAARRTAINFVMQELGGQKREDSITIIQSVISALDEERKGMWMNIDASNAGGTFTAHPGGK